MPAIVLGVAAAVLAAACYSVGVMLQALDARTAPAQERLRPALIRRLLGRARWLAGTALTIAGWPLQLLALLSASIVVVQPALSVGLLILLALSARILSERPRRIDVAATLAIIAGIALLVAVAPAPSYRHAGGLGLVVTLSALAAVVVVPYALSWTGRHLRLAPVIGAGVGDALSALGSALVADAVHHHEWLPALGWAALVASSAVAALVCEMSALQDQPAIRVAPTVFAVQTVLPVALAPWLLHAHLAGGGRIAGVIAALALVLAGSWTISRSPPVLGLAA